MDIAEDQPPVELCPTLRWSYAGDKDVTYNRGELKHDSGLKALTMPLCLEVVLVCEVVVIIISTLADEARAELIHLLV